MGFMDRLRGSTVLREPVDILLADIAIRVQLTATDHNKAVARYQTINEWLERDGSPLQGRVQLLYAQGSMAIGATIAARLRTDEYDIDIIVELDLPSGLDAETILDLLFHSIRGKPGSRYYSMTSRRNRCVTVSYADGMHLDLTPAELVVPQLAPRTSLICHHKPETPEVPGFRLVANPFGFADWFKQMTPLDHFAEAFAKRAFDAEQRMLVEKADAVPVPPQEEAHRKSKAVIALQLLKRARNVRYDSRHNRRRPPSVMLAKLIADGANMTTTLSEEVLHQARQVHETIAAAHRQGVLISIFNPRCDRDCFTDRWPGTRAEQATYLGDLADFVGKVEYLRSGECDLREMQAVMVDLFGENPTGAVFKSFNEQLGDRIRTGQSVYRPGTSNLDLTKSGLLRPAAPVIVPAATVTTPRHTFFGGDRRE
ncbi:MAG TPA: nucleotidyltransferase [Stellaceae bacterium]